MSQDDLIGKQLDEYYLEELLGKGGMARVYRGMDTRLKRWVAIKVIDPPFRKDESYLMRFEREAQAIAQLQHPNIVSIYRYGDAEGMLYMAMQFVEGSPLDKLIRSYHKEGNLMPVEEARRIIRETCLALDYAHNRGVIHRDIKPANIILDKQGTAILADFGLALLEEQGTQGEIFGTPHYIAPEQAISSASAVPQSDLYAIGVMIYEIFTGVLPFDGSDALEVAMMHMTDEVPPPSEANPDISEELEAVIMKALAKEPTERYPKGIELINALDKALTKTRKSSSHILDSRMTVTHRVALDLEENPLPPMPSGVSAPPPPEPEPDPEPSLPPMPGGVSEPTRPEPEPEPITAPAPTPAPTTQQAVKGSSPAAVTPAQSSSNALDAIPPDKMPFLYIGAGAAIVIILGFCAFLMFSGGEEPETVAESTKTVVATVDSAVVSSENSENVGSGPATEESSAPPSEPTMAPTEPSATEPTMEPVDPPPPAMLPDEDEESEQQNEDEDATSEEDEDEVEHRIVADSRLDFGEDPENWAYVWSERGDNDWSPMEEYSANHYGDECWHLDDKEHIRVCHNSAHPGRGEIVAWVWINREIEGPLEAVISAGKIDRGGNGVAISVFHVSGENGNAVRIMEEKLKGKEKDPLGVRLTFEEILPEDAIFFVMDGEKNSDADHTAFRTIICEPTCSENPFEENDDNGGFRFEID